MVEKISPDDFPAHRMLRWSEINSLEVGEAIFIPDSDFKTESADISAALRSTLWYRSKKLNRKFQSRRGVHKAHRGTFIKRLE